jgi:uncharacterized protein
MPIDPSDCFLLSALAVAVMAASAPPSNAASFSCERATTPVEKAICETPEISDLDEFLGRYYAAGRMSLKHAEGCLVSDQRSWVRTVRDACKDAACLKAAYLERLAVLHAVQPGATSLRSIELPQRPSLVWIVPPAADQVAAPRNTPTTPLALNGKIINEVATGDGYVLQSDVGAKHTIASLMFLEEPTTDALARLARSTESRYEVRGRTETRVRAPKPFAASQCTYIYRTAR